MGVMMMRLHERVVCFSAEWEILEFLPDEKVLLKPSGVGARNLDNKIISTRWIRQKDTKGNRCKMN